jgi:DNA polymerase I
MIQTIRSNEGLNRGSSNPGEIPDGPHGVEDAVDEPFSADAILGREGVNVQVIVRPDHAREALNNLATVKHILGLDIETEKLTGYEDHPKAGLDPHLSRIRLIQVFDGRTVYVFDVASTGLEPLQRLKDLQVVAHNAAFEMKHLMKVGLAPTKIDCTMLMANALEGNLSSLATLAKSHLGWTIDKELQTSDWCAKELSQDQISYAALDAVGALRLYEALYEELNERALFNVYTLMLKASQPIAMMELNGIAFNTEAHGKLMAAWEKEKEDVKGVLKDLMGPELNFASNPQISDWMKNNLDADVLEKWPKTKKGQLQTGAQTLANFSDHPVIKPLLRFKKFAKLLSTYGSKYAAHVNPITGRIHANFRLGGTVSGRLSCDSPNMQNLPRGKDFRGLFSVPWGKMLLAADYGQIELRVAALLSGDEVMLEAYERGLDLHKKTGSEISGVPFEEVTKEQRQGAKAINFGLLYGQGAKGLADYARTSYGVEMTVSEAEKARKAFFRTYSGLAQWQEKTARISKLRQKVMTPGGRVRDFIKSKRGYSYTEAINTPIQGGAAEVMLAALVLLSDYLKGIDAKLVNIVHDEFVLEVDKGDQIAMVAVQAAMEEGMLQIFPEASTRNLVEINSGFNWAEAK